MKPVSYYPIMLDLTDKLCVIIGGGSVAARKAKGLLAAGARLRIISPRLHENLGTHFLEGRLEWIARGYSRGDLAGALLAMTTADKHQVNEAVGEEARELGILLLRADEPSAGDFILPAVHTRGGLQIAVSTGGQAPFLARQIKEELKGHYDDAYNELVKLVGDIRSGLLLEDGAAGKVEGLQRILPGLKDTLLTRIRQGESVESLKQEICRQLFEQLKKDRGRDG